MNQLHCRHSILETTPQGIILEVSFSGVHEHGVGLQVGKYVEETVHQSNPAAVVLNFLEFEYVFGNDIAGLQWAFFNRSADKRITIRPCRDRGKGADCQIVAQSHSIREFASSGRHSVRRKH